MRIRCIPGECVMSVDHSDGLIDYEKLFVQFGTSPVDEGIIERFEKVVDEEIGVHPFIKRGLFYSHRELELILDAHECGEGFYLYTGIGPSSESMHIGHLVPFMFTKYLQDVFKVPVVIQVTDDEKFLKKDFTFEEIERMAVENVKDIIACGFDIENTFIFSNTQFMGSLYHNILRVQKKVTNSQVRNIFGIVNSDNIGITSFPAIQVVPSFSSTFSGNIFPPGTKLRCLIPCGIDQDPYFRLTRDVAPKLDEFKPSLVHSKFIPGLKGVDTKMSSSTPSSAIFLTDDADTIKNKINKYAFSGGKSTLKEHREQGADLDIDISYQYLKYFLSNDEELNEITSLYASGELLTHQVKSKIIDLLTNIILTHQHHRSLIDNTTLKTFSTIRTLSCFK